MKAVLVNTALPAVLRALPVRGMSAGLLLLLCGICLEATGQENPPAFHTQTRFLQELNRPLTASRNEVPLREFLDRLSEVRGIAILLDCRIDPGRIINVDVNADFLDAGVGEAVAQAGCEVAVLADTLFVTRPETARTLRTRIYVQRERLEELIRENPRRQFELLRRRPVIWEKLATPRELLVRTALRSGLTVENPEEVPHDMWAAGGLAYPNVIETLSVLLAQFDLDFEWTGPDSVRIVPQPEPEPIRQTHPVRRMPADEARARLLQRFPDLKVRQRNDRLEVDAFLEEHEEIAILLGNAPPRRSLREPLENVRFSLRMVQQPFSGLLQLLSEKHGIQVEYDPAALAEAGIDLNRRISIELEQATLEQLLAAACREAGLDFRMEGRRLILSPPE
jgi:hypothetical protein